MGQYTRDTEIKMHVKDMAVNYLLMEITMSGNGLKTGKMEKVPM